jgi:hypothetical protein
VIAIMMMMIAICCINIISTSIDRSIASSESHVYQWYFES